MCNNLSCQPIPIKIPLESFYVKNEAFRFKYTSRVEVSLKKKTLNTKHTVYMYVHILYKYKPHLRFKLNYLPLTMLNRNWSWLINRQTKWCDLKIYRLLPLVMKYYCTKFKSCTIKSIWVIVSQWKCLQTNLEGLTVWLRWPKNVKSIQQQWWLRQKKIDQKSSG